MAQNEKCVSVVIDYPSHDAATVTVDPEEVAIYYNRNGGPGDSTLARKVRWDVDGVREGDCVLIRPKSDLDEWTKSIFVPPAGKQAFEATTLERSIACDPPVFGVDPGQFPIHWEYEAIVVRNGTPIGECDPVIKIEEDP